MSTSTHELEHDTTPQSSSSSSSKLPQLPSTILVADDEHLVATGIAANLGELGFEVIGPASDGDEAISLCERARPDLAVLDIRMPGTSGLDAAKIIFERFGVPVMILSAYSDPEQVRDAASSGVFGYLLKPVSKDQMRAAINIAWTRFLGSATQAEEIESLKSRLESRKIVEQAKWVLVKRKGIDEPEAMRLLQRNARNNRRTLADVARSVLESEDLFGE